MSHEHDDDAWNEFPVCPECGEPDGDWWDGSSMRFDGDSEVVDCGNCETQYKRRMCVETTFATQRWTTLDQLRETLRAARVYEKGWRSVGRFDAAAAANDRTCALELQVIREALSG